MMAMFETILEGWGTTTLVGVGILVAAPVLLPVVGAVILSEKYLTTARKEEYRQKQRAEAPPHRAWAPTEKRVRRGNLFSAKTSRCSQPAVCLSWNPPIPDLFLMSVPSTLLVWPYG